MVIVKGSQYESPSVMLQGHLVFSLPDTMSAKRISLKLVGKYKLDFLEVLSHSRSTVSSPVKQEAVIFEIDWDNLLVNAEGVTKVGTDTKVSMSNGEQRVSGRYTISGSSTHAKNSSPQKKLHRANAPSSLTLPVNGVSGTPFENISTPNGTSFILPGGNYDLPFKCVLPGDIPETVEGLVAGSVLYKFEASIDRGSFKSPINKYKYFRIFRTLSSDSLQLSETMSIGKTWPGKVQYEVSIPARAVPIGGKSPLNILLVPLIKGMKLGPIKAQIIQYYAFRGVTGDVYDDQQQVLDLTMTQMENHILDDKLAIESFIDLPLNLKKVTQDCDLKEDLIKVRHKLKVQINLIQPNGHVSELRANLPISLYVSPKADMTGRTIVLDKNGKIHFRKEEEPLFERNKHLPGQPQATNREANFQLAQTEDSAPPNYEAHIFDRLYGDTSSGNNSSTSGDNSNINSHPVSPNYTPGTRSPLPVLQNQTQQQGLSQASEDPDLSYFGIPTRPGSRNMNGDSAPVSPLLDASIHNHHGHNIDDELSRSLEALKFSHISDLPSYQDAMDGDDEPDEVEEFAPNYEGSDKDENSEDGDDVGYFGGRSPGVSTLNSANNSASHSRTNSLPGSRVGTPKRESPLKKVSPVGKIELPKPEPVLHVQPQRPSAFRSSSLNNILSRHGSSSNLNTNATSSKQANSTHTSSSNLSKLAYKKFIRSKEKK